MGLTSFFGSYGKTKLDDLGTSLVKALVNFDPEGASEAQIGEMDQELVALSERGTRQLLAFSRKQVLSPRVLDINEVVGGLESMLHRMIGEDIHLLPVLDPGVWPILADRGQIDQVIMNLVVNARDAMPRGGKIIVSTSNTVVGASSPETPMKPGRYVVLTVADTGSGMDDETKAHIFEPFFTTKEQEKGTGLGLSTVYGIVKQSGGYVWVDSALGVGTVFKICFPRHTGENDVDATSDDAPAKTRSDSGTILLVEDDDAVRMFACRLLSDAGYRVIEAENGEKALALSREYPGNIDLVLTDLIMPGVNGHELSLRIHQDRPTAKTLFMSAYDEAIIRDRTAIRDMSVFIQKPFTVDEMLRKIREILRTRAMNGDSRGE